MKNPSIRLNIDEENWIKKQLSSNNSHLCSITTGKLNANAMDANGIYPFFTCDEKPYKINTYAFDTNALLISGNGSQVGHINSYNGKFNAYQRTYVLYDFINIEKDFLFQIMKKRLKKYIQDNCQQGSIPYITLPMLQNFTTYSPKVEIQSKIANILSNLDTKIEKQRLLIAKLKVIKQALLAMLFPIGNNNMPSLRHRGYIGAWEQRQLRELSEKTYGGGTPSTTNFDYWNGNIAWLQSSDIIEGKLFDVVPKKFISQLGLNNSVTQLIPKNSIAIITRVGVGKLAFIPFPYTTSQDFLSLSKLKTESFFTIYACYKKLQLRLNELQGTSIKGITKNELLDKKITIPNYDEQKLIGEYFRQFDSLIALHERKLEKLKQIKLALLDKMLI